MRKKSSRTAYGRSAAVRILARLQNLGQRFTDDRAGAIAIMFAFMLTLVVSIVGGSVDYARWLAARSSTIYAMDAAVLAGGRALQLGKTDAQAIDIATSYYNRVKSNRLSVDQVTFTVENNRSEMVATTDSKVATPLLSVAGVDSLAIRETARAAVTVGANSGSHVEISLMLDTTGSMGWSSSSGGSKMSHLKAAALDLINIVVWDDQSEYTSRVSLAPFAEHVNVSKNYFEAITDEYQSDNEKTCVRERQGTNRYTDEAPGSGNGYFDHYTGSWSCKPKSAFILPLTNDKTVLENAINSLPTTGGTAGHLGTAWAWYLLSPKWNSIWPAAAQAKPYEMMAELNDHGQPVLRKIAVLMTDGEYNRKYSGDSSTTQARALCDNMKAAGITVYSIGFEIAVGGQADTTMAQCATSSSHYYNAADGNELRSAFRDIALKISTLRIAE